MHPRPMPVDRLLVPDRVAAVPDGFTRLRQALAGGLPASFRLDAELALAVYLPTGLARRWQDARGDDVIARAADDDAPHHDGAAPTVRPPFRLVLLQAGAIAAAVPLVPGPRRRLPDGDGDRALVELVVLDYQINAGSLRQAGDFGSFLDLAWRRADRGADRFALPPIAPRVAARFAGAVQSQVGERGGYQDGDR